MSTTNGVNGASPSSRFDPGFTQHVLDTMGENVAPRTRLVLGSLIRHIHDFAREVELTNDEWMAGVHFVNSIGQTSTKTRNEAHRISDVLGLES
jgi:catechol 1,2-dioxygenase